MERKKNFSPLHSLTNLVTLDEPCWDHAELLVKNVVSNLGRFHHPFALPSLRKERPLGFSVANVGNANLKIFPGKL